MKKIVSVLACLFICGICFSYGVDKPVVVTNDTAVVYDNTDITDAAVIDVPFAGGVDLESIFNQLRIAELLSFAGESYTGLYMPILSLKSDDLELVNLVFGGVFKNTDTKGYPLVGITLRVDGILESIGALDWITDHFDVVKFPAIEFGPFASYDFITPKGIYGFLFAYKFGG